MEDPATPHPAVAAPAPRRRPRWTDRLGPWKGPYQLVWFAVLALALANVWFGPLNQDEGWYLLAAQNVDRGLMPYRDFLYTQGPALPYVYGFVAGAWSDAGVLGGRLVTALFGFLATVFFAVVAGELARRRDPDAFGPAFFLAFVLLGLSPDWAYFTAIPKTYALGSLFLALGFGLSLGAPGNPNRRGSAMAGACFALAAATRATLCLAAVPVWIALIVLARRDRAHRLDWLWFAVGCAAALALVYAPFLASCPENFLFSQTYHAARASAPFGEWLVLRAGFLCFLAQGYPALVAAAAILAAAATRAGVESVKCKGKSFPCEDGTRKKSNFTLYPFNFKQFDPLYLAVVSSFVLLTAAHFLVPFPYADYNTPAMPLAAVALAVPLGRLVVCANLRPWRVGLVALAASLAFVAASPWPMKWVDGEQHLFWFHSSLDSALARLRRAGRVVREQNPAGKPIFTQDAYLAVEAGVPVVPGFEMGPFSIFPDLSDDEARAHRVHNVATAEAAIREADYDVAALSGYTFLLGCPSTAPLPFSDRERLREAVRAPFGAPVHSEHRFGQQNTELLIYSRNAPDEEEWSMGDGWVR